LINHVLINDLAAISTLHALLGEFWTQWELGVALQEDFDSWPHAELEEVYRVISRLERCNELVH
jgi:hypothetical protein